MRADPVKAALRLRRRPCATICLSSIDAFAMPELPEVETTRRGLAPHVRGRRIAGVTLRRPDLRWPIP